MQLIYKPAVAATDQCSMVVVEHDGKSIWFDTSYLDSSRKQNLTEIGLMNEVNIILSQCDKETQDSMFETYNQIKVVMSKASDELDMVRLLQPLVAELTNFLDLDKIRHWVGYHSELRLPATVQHVTFKEGGDAPGTVDQTYVISDYWGLVTMVIALRALLPVWGEVISRTQNMVDNQWKEKYAFSILFQSHLMDSEPMTRLIRYVNANISQDKRDSLAAAIFSGLSSEDVGNWLLALLVIRRLTVGDIRGTIPNRTIIHSMFSYITNKLDRIESGFRVGNSSTSDVRKKPDVTDITEGKMSVAEGYRSRQETAIADIQAIQYALNNPLAMAKRIAPTITNSLVERVVKYAKKTIENEPLPCQNTLVQWVLASEIPPAAFEGGGLISNIHRVKAYAVAQAVLWHAGHHELAALITARSDGPQHLDSPRSRIPVNLLERFDVLFPYQPRNSLKDQREKNHAVTVVENLNKEFSNVSWALTMPEELIQQLGNNNSGPHFQVPGDIKIKMATLAIQLAEGNFAK